MNHDHHCKKTKIKNILAGVDGQTKIPGHKISYLSHGQDGSLNASSTEPKTIEQRK